MKLIKFLVLGNYGGIPFATPGQTAVTQTSATTAQNPQMYTTVAGSDLSSYLQVGMFCHARHSIKSVLAPTDYNGHDFSLNNAVNLGKYSFNYCSIVGSVMKID